MADEYVVQSGPLRTLEAVFDNRFDKLKHVADYHTILITAKPVTKRIVINALRRSIAREIVFVSSLFSALAGGARALFGLRDVSAAKAQALNDALWKRDPSDLLFDKMSYGFTEDDLLLVELKNFSEHMEFLQPFVPPSEGSIFFYLTTQPFEVFKIHWQRAAQASLKSKDDRFRRDILAHAHETQMTLWQDPDGGFGIVLNPKIEDVEAVEAQIITAGEKAGMAITFAPGLFG